MGISVGEEGGGTKFLVLWHLSTVGRLKWKGKTGGGGEGGGLHHKG